MTIKGVLLDIDNTLYPYAPCNEAGKEAAWRKAKDLKYEVSRSEFEEFYRMGRNEVKRDLAGTGSAHDRFLYFKRAVGHCTGTHRARDSIDLAEAFWEAYYDEMEIFPTVENTLKEIKKRGLKIAITSDLTTRIQLEKIDVLGIEDYIDLLITSEETGRDKPSSSMFTLPLLELDLKAKEAIMVGDSISSDIAGGNSIGLTTVLFNEEFDEGVHEEWKKPDFQIDKFSELLDILEKAPSVSEKAGRKRMESTCKLKERNNYENGK